MLSAYNVGARCCQIIMSEFDLVTRSIHMRERDELYVARRWWDTDADDLDLADELRHCSCVREREERLTSYRKEFLLFKFVPNLRKLVGGCCCQLIMSEFDLVFGLVSRLSNLAF